MAEGDTILRAARRIEAALGGQELGVRSGNGPGRAAGVEKLDGRRLDRVETRGKHLLLHLDELVLHSHLGLSGSWQVCRQGDHWRKPASAAWVTLSGDQLEAVQFGGPTLRVLSRARLRRDPVLGRLGADILAADFDLVAATAALRVSPERELGELSDEELGKTLEAARRLMRESVARGRPSNAVYRRAGRPCRVCGTRISANGQGDANRRTYWCARCQGPS